MSNAGYTSPETGQPSEPPERSEPAQPVTGATDGRAARRERNVTTVLDCVLEMFAEDSLFPTMEQVAKRSGLSLRSLYRYFSDPGDLLESTIMRSRERAVKVAGLQAIGTGSIEHRIDAFVAMRLKVHDASGAVWHAAVANAARHPRIGEELAATRIELREQFARQFSPELRLADAELRSTLLAAGDLASQPGSIDFLRRTRGLSVDESHAVLVLTLQSLLR